MKRAKMSTKDTKNTKSAKGKSPKSKKHARAAALPLPTTSRAARRKVAPRRETGLKAGRPTDVAMTYLRPWGVLPRAAGAATRSLRTLKEIRDYNPDAAMAVWNFLRLINKGAKLSVEDLDGAPDEAAQARIDELLGTVGREYGGGLGALANVCALVLVTQGAVAGELALADNLKDVLDWCPVDPELVTFTTDKKTGRVYPTLMAVAQGEPLPELQFRYVPLDPDVNDPYGRGPMWPALEVTFFQMEVLRDLRAVAHTAGYPHIDVSVIYEIVAANLPAHLKEPGKEQEAQAWMDGMLSDLQTAYNALEPDDVWIHYDIAKPSYVGPGSAGTINLSALIDVLDQQVVSSLKQMPILLGRNFGSTETHASRQWEIFVEGIGTLRGVIARLVEFWGDMTLRVWGLQGKTRLAFGSLRATDRLKDAQAERIETDTAIRLMLAGFLTQDQAAQKAVGHEAVGPVLLPELLQVGAAMAAPEASPDGGDGRNFTPPSPALLTSGGQGTRANNELADVLATPQWMQALFRGLSGDLGVTLRQAVNESAIRVGEITEEEWNGAE